MAEGNAVTPEDISLPFKPLLASSEAAVRVPEGGFQWDAMEKGLLLQALSMSNWVQKDAATLLGLSTRVLNYKIKQFGITHPNWRQNK